MVLHAQRIKYYFKVPPPPNILLFNICLYFHFTKGPGDAPFEKSSANKPKLLNYSYMFLKDTEFLHVFALKMIKKKKTPKFWEENKFLNFTAIQSLQYLNS